MRALVVVALLATRAAAEPLAELDAAANRAGADRDHCDRLAGDYQRALAALVALGPEQDLAVGERIVPAVGRLFASATACAGLPIEAISRQLLLAVDGPYDAPKPSRPPSPAPLTRRAERIVIACGIALDVLAAGETRAHIAFAKATVLAAFGRDGEAVPLYLDIIDKEPRTSGALIAVDRALDAYNRLGRHDELAALVERLRADKPFLAKRDELAQRLDKIHRQVLATKAQGLGSEAGRTGELATYRACGQVYLALADEDPQGTDGDVLLYDATVCFGHGKADADAQQAIDKLASRYPKSQLVARARAQLHP